MQLATGAYGERASEAAARKLGPGGFYTEPARQPRFAFTNDLDAVVYITGDGPTDTTYVVATDSPGHTRRSFVKAQVNHLRQRAGRPAGFLRYRKYIAELGGVFVTILIMARKAVAPCVKDTSARAISAAGILVGSTAFVEVSAFGAMRRPASDALRQRADRDERGRRAANWGGQQVGASSVVRQWATPWRPARKN